MEEISIKAEELFYIGGFEVTNSMVMALVASLILFCVALFVNRNLKKVPGKLQSVFELLFEGMLALMDSVLGDRKKSLRYLPIIATIFLFVLVSNWLGLFPFTGPITYEHVPLFRAPTSDLNFTIMLGIVSVLSVNLLGALALGVRRHVGKFFNFHSPIMFFVGLLELVSEFVKIVSFSFRLFGNVFAGEVLLIIVGFLLPYLVPLPFLLLEVFVGFIQAFIFSMLTVVFIAMSVSEEPAH